MTAAAAEPRRSLGRVFSLGLAVSASTAVVAIVRGKVAAVVLGPAGLGVTAEVQQVLSAGLTLATVAAGPALVQAVARGTRADAGSDAIAAAQGAYDTAWTTTAALGVAGVLIAALVARFSFPWGAGGWWWVLVMGAGLAINLGSGVTGRMLSAAGRVRPFSIGSVTAVAIQALSVAVGTVLLGLPGFFLGNLSGALIAAPLWQGIAAGAGLPLRTAPRPRVEGHHVAEAARLGLASLAGSGSTTLTLLVIRWALAHGPGSAANGLFQAAWSIDGVLIASVLSTMTNFIGPRYAAARDADELRREVDAAAVFVLRVAPPILLAAIAVRGPVLTALYSAEFRPAVELLGWILAGDVAKNVSWTQGYALLYRGHARIFGILQLVGSLLFGGLSLAGIAAYGLVGIGYAWFAVYLLNVGMTAVALRQAEGVSASGRVLALAIGGATLALGANLAVGVAWWGPAVPLLLAGIWAVAAGLPQAAWRAARR